MKIKLAAMLLFSAALNINAMDNIKDDKEFTTPTIKLFTPKKSRSVSYLVNNANGFDCAMRVLAEITIQCFHKSITERLGKNQAEWIESALRLITALGVGRMRAAKFNNGAYSGLKNQCVAIIICMLAWCLYNKSEYFKKIIDKAGLDEFIQLFNLQTMNAAQVLRYLGGKLEHNVVALFSKLAGIL